MDQAVTRAILTLEFWPVDVVAVVVASLQT
jgi:hypothetical protein